MQLNPQESGGYFPVPIEFIEFQGLNLVLAQMDIIEVTSKSEGRTFHLKSDFWLAEEN